MRISPWFFTILFGVLVAWSPLSIAQTVALPEAAPSSNAIHAVAPASVASAIPCDQCDQCAGAVAGQGCGMGSRRGPLSESFSKYYNCRYHGSYNYPVPPQFTYFWPGIYKQKSIADYQSVYRNTMLASPSDVFNPNAAINAQPVMGKQTIINQNAQ